MAETLESIRARYGSTAAAARAYCMRVSTFRDRLVAGQIEPLPEGVATTPPPTAVPARRLADFRREHDQSWKIRDGIARLFEGRDTYMPDSEFRQAVGGHPSRWRAAAEAQEFAPNRKRVNGDLLWASAATIAEMRRILGEAL